MGHKRFSPSGSKRWLACPGSIPLVESLDLPDSTNDASELGTGVHEIGELCLRDQDLLPADFLKTKMNGHVIEQDCIDAIIIYIDYCKDFFFHLLPAIL